jgi:hypothetical protein
MSESPFDIEVTREFDALRNASTEPSPFRTISLSGTDLWDSPRTGTAYNSTRMLADCSDSRWLSRKTRRCGHRGTAHFTEVVENELLA